MIKIIFFLFFLPFRLLDFNMAWNNELSHMNMARFEKLTRIRSINIREHNLGFIPDFRDVARRTIRGKLTIYADYPFNTRCDYTFCWIWELPNRYCYSDPLYTNLLKNVNSFVNKLIFIITNRRKQQNKLLMYRK